MPNFKKIKRKNENMFEKIYRLLLKKIPNLTVDPKNRKPKKSLA